MRSRASAFPLLLLALLVIGACSANPSASAGTRRNPDLITTEELRASPFGNVLEAVRSLRSAWLRERPPSTFGPPDIVMIYVDNVRWGEVSTLGQVSTNGVVSIEWVNPVDATQRWGPGHAAGVIWVHTVQP